MGDDDTHMNQLLDKFLWIAAVRKDGKVIHMNDDQNEQTIQLTALSCRNTLPIILTQSRAFEFIVVQNVSDSKIRLYHIGDVNPEMYKVFDDEETAIMYAVMKANQQ